MIAAVFNGVNQLELVEKKSPKALPGTIEIEVMACAICGSDLRTMREGQKRIKTPRVLGHEIAGRVVEVGKGVTNYSVNDRVSTGADIPCGQCSYCNEGLPNSCEMNLAIGYQFDGGFSQYMILDPLIVKYGPLQKFGTELEWNLAALAEPLACCINGYEQALAPIKKPKKLVIFGAGPIGLMLLALGKALYGIEHSTIIEPSKFRRQIAKKFAPDLVLDRIDEKTSLEQFSGSLGVGEADIVFTACPSLEAHKDAVKIVAKNGVINLFGGIGKYEKPLSLLSNHIHYRQFYVTGSHGSTPAQHAQALKLIEDKSIELNDLITHEYPLKDINKAFKLAESGKACKVVIKP